MPIIDGQITKIGYSADNGETWNLLYQADEYIVIFERDGATRCTILQAASESDALTQALQGQGWLDSDGRWLIDSARLSWSISKVA